MNPSFHIQAAQIDTTSAHLFVEAGPMGISFVILDAGNCFAAAVVYAFPAGINAATIADKLEEIITRETILQQQYKKKDILWAFPESILVPPEFMDTAANSEMLNLIYGDLNRGNCKTDFLFKHNLHNAYRVPVEVSNGFARHFSYAGETHQYSLLPDLVTNTGDHLLAVFYNSCLTVVLRKEGNLQVIRNFEYHHPDDAAYHLLNVCENFEVDIATVVLHLAGMIDAGSSLYAGIYKYFLNIQFETLPGNVSYTDEIKEQPHHYFSYLFALALCV